MAHQTQTLREKIATEAPYATNTHTATDGGEDIQTAIDDATRTAVEAAIRSTRPLPDFEAFYRADDAAAEVTDA